MIAKHIKAKANFNENKSKIELAVNNNRPE